MTPFSTGNDNSTHESSIWQDELHEHSIDEDMRLTVSISKVCQRQHSDDDATTYSSRNEDEAREFSSRRSTEDHEPSLVSEQQEGEDEHCFSSNKQQRELRRAILTERAAMLLRRESSMEYRVIDNYCVNEVVAELSNVSLQTTASDCEQTAKDANVMSAIRRSSCATSKTRPAPEIDATCRSKMMEWAIRVVEFSYPPDQSSRSNAPSKNTRRHSIEALHIISTAFSYVDRIMGQSRVRAAYQMQRKRTVLLITTRKEYKLLCIICLHLAAKMSGLFDSTGVDHSVDKKVEETGSAVATKSSARASTSDCTVTTVTTTCSSFNSLSSLSCASEQSSETMPSNHSRCHSHQAIYRPSLRLLSLHGLQSLCQGEFTINEMCQMELSILTSLEWKMNSGLVLEWLDLILEWSALLGRGGTLTDSADETYDWEEIKERALVRVEAAVRSHEFMTVIPSVSAVAALASAIDDCSERDFPETLCYLVTNLTEVLGVPCRVEDLNDVMTAMERHVKNNC